MTVYDCNVDISLKIEKEYYVPGQHVQGVAYLTVRGPAVYSSLSLHLVGFQHTEYLHTIPSKRFINRQTTYQGDFTLN